MVLKELKNGKRKSITPLKSPTSGVLTPNDDAREREHVRVKRRIAESRKSLGADFDLQAPPQAQHLSGRQLDDLVSNCLKLASENKISVKNTWSLNLIDHMADLVKADRDTETNFQKASVTLDAGVKIYSYRVDSVHNETFKMLTGLTRAAVPGELPEEDNADEDDEEGTQGQDGEGGKKKTGTRKAVDTDPTSTLESEEAIKMHKVESSFAVDPLFTRTSAQFDEGGAKGLLLLNLSVWGGCNVVFDSNAVPAQEMAAVQHAGDAVFDMTALAKHIPRVLLERPCLTPTLSAITSLLRDRTDGDAADRSESPAAEESEERAEVTAEVEAILEGAAGERLDGFGDGPMQTTEGMGLEALREDDDVYGAEDGYGDAGDWGHEGSEGEGEAGSGDRHLVALTGEAAQTTEGSVLERILASHGQLSVPAKGWAGALHWRFRPPGSRPPPAGPRPRRERAVFDFENLPELDMTRFAKAKAKDIVLARQTVSKASSSLLPEHDYAFDPASLTRLLTKPHVAIRAVAAAGAPATPGRALAQWGTPGGPGSSAAGHAMDGGAYDDDDDDYGHETDWGNVDFGALAEQGGAEGAGVEGEGDGTAIVPRKVAKVEIAYDRVSKQVDVRALKSLLWESLQQGAGAQDGAAGVNFHEALRSLPPMSAAGHVADLSVHLCFICLLHLCNEHNLSLEDGRAWGRQDLATLLVGGVGGA